MDKVLYCCFEVSEEIIQYFSYNGKLSNYCFTLVKYE